MFVKYDEETKIFHLESGEASYVFCVNEFGILQHLYFGKRIEASDDVRYLAVSIDRGHSVGAPGMPSRAYTGGEFFYEYACAHRGDYRECAVELTDGRGASASDLRYVSHEILECKPPICGMPSLSGDNALKVTLRDEISGAVVDLYYSAFDDCSVIARRAEIHNPTAAPLKIKRAYSACVDFYGSAWDVITLPGAHCGERQIERGRARRGVIAASSSRGVSSGQCNPFMAVVSPDCTEKVGLAYGFNLIYSGDFVLKAGLDQDNNLRVVGGINDFGFEWTLGAGETFATPETAIAFSDRGLGGMSRAFHDVYRNHLINPRFVKARRPVVINNWEGTYFNFDTKKLCDIIKAVKGSGIDAFVLDDGWFGVRNGDRSGLGDWFVNLDKLPDGLTPIIECAHENGMRFGLWFEPEMVNKDSDLYRAHPDWAIAINGVEPCVGRDQLVLDLSRDEVVDYIASVVGKILDEYEIDYVKWDMNRPLADDWSHALGERSGELHHRYVLGFYKLCDRLVGGYPEIFFEGCASGGCRFDPAAAFYFPQIWTSDNTDAYERTRIQYGTSLCYPLSMHSCHVSASPNHGTRRTTSFKTRGDVARLGATGYELDTTQLGADDLAAIKGQVEAFRGVEDLVLNGDLYRLADPSTSNYFAEEIVSRDKSDAYITAMCALVRPNAEIFRLYPGGLDEKAVYRVTDYADSVSVGGKIDFTASGAALMNAGFPVFFGSGDFATKTIRVTRVK